MTTLHALKQYLESRWYSNISLDGLPEQSEQLDAVSLLKLDHTVGTVNDGTGTHFIQIQVRRAEYAQAESVCHELFQLLDSGLNETLIDLSESVFCIARPYKGPLQLERGTDFTTFYCEIALWGKN